MGALNTAATATGPLAAVGPDRLLAAALGFLMTNGPARPGATGSKTPTTTGPQPPPTTAPKPAAAPARALTKEEPCAY